MKPAGLSQARKNNDNKKWKERELWMQSKKQARPYQQFNEETKQWSKIMLPTKVTA